MILVVFVGGVGLALLALADFETAGNGSRDPRARAQWTWERGDRVHYAVHIFAARLLDICPCTRQAADFQYFRAHWHALTPNQKAVVNLGRPHSPATLIAYVVAPFSVGIDWVGDGFAWLGGQRPAREVVVELDDYRVQPAEIYVARGTTVMWRNVDELGEAHTVTADSGQSATFDSDWLVPDESFGYTFSERGRYSYYCRVHGGAGLKGMAGAVVVE